MIFDTIFSAIWFSGGVSFFNIYLDAFVLWETRSVQFHLMQHIQEYLISTSLDVDFQ